MSETQTNQTNHEQQQQQQKRPRVPKVVLEVAYDPEGPKENGYRGVITGGNGKKIRSITEKTGTQITFQDANRDRGKQYPRPQ